MTWPISDVDTTDVDADTDSPLLARQDLLDLIQKFNQMRNHVSTFIRTLLDDIDAPAARATLGLGDAAVQNTTAFWSTGDVKVTFKTSADSGWVVMNDGTIGNAASGATTRANADTLALFILLYTNTVDADCPVSGGRTGNATNDFNANKTIALPKALGRNLAIAGAGSGLTSRALASVLGTETKTIAQANLPATGLSIPALTVNVSSTIPTYSNGGGSVTGRLFKDDGSGAGVQNTLGVGGSGATDASTTGNMGSGTAMDVMNPRFHANVMIKL